MDIETEVTEREKKVMREEKMRVTEEDAEQVKAGQCHKSNLTSGPIGEPTELK